DPADMFGDLSMSACSTGTGWRERKGGSLWATHATPSVRGLKMGQRRRSSESPQPNQRTTGAVSMQQWFGLVVVLCNLVSAWVSLDCLDALGTDSNLAAGGIDGWSAMPVSSHLLTAQAAALLPGQSRAT